jgi:RHS repeat-associated protein
MAKTNFFWDDLEDNVIEEYGDDGNTVAEYTTEPDHLGNVISQHRDSQTTLSHYDVQGSVIAATNASQQVTDTFAYSAFGEVTERTGTTELPFQFLGQEGYYRDRFTEQYRIRRREYEAVSSRWLSEDPRPTGLSNGSSYKYCENNPTNLFDPSGMIPTGPTTIPSLNPVCQVQLACARIGPGIGPKHCGLEIKDRHGIARFHVPFGQTCRIIDGRVTVEWVFSERNYYVVASWGDSSGWLCQCVRATVDAINRNHVNMPYSPIPYNKCFPQGGSYSTCNSNYTTHCLMKSCGIDFRNWIPFFKPVGWNYRMTECLSSHLEEYRDSPVDVGDIGEKKCKCVCDLSVPIDEGWCADSSTAQRLSDRVFVEF